MKFRWFLRPFLVLMFSVLALGASFFLYLRWYLVARFRILEIIEKYGLDQGQIFEAEAWIVILVLSLLLVVIVAGIALIFFYLQKVTKLVRLQDNFISGFTHELKTPLASLQLAVDTFSRLELPKEKREKLLGNMRNDIQRLSGNVARILNLAKLEGNRKLAELQWIELNGFLDDLVKSDHFSDLTGEISFKIGDEPFTISADAELLEILVENLVTNSFKYNKSEIPRINIWTEKTGKKVSVFFKDNGIGIPQKDRKKIFRKFYQVGTSKNMSAKGSGLGLYIVSQIARMHQGDIKLIKSGHEGSLFCLTLPLAREEF